MRSEITSRRYIPELDGLRALAVILVLVAHFGPQADIGSRLWMLESHILSGLKPLSSRTARLCVGNPARNSDDVVPSSVQRCTFPAVGTP